MGKKEVLLLLIILFLVALFNFHYPLMKIYQEGGEFSVTTPWGDSGFTQDIIWFGNDIISVYEHPGLFLRDSITYEHQNEIIPLQGSFEHIVHALIYAVSQNMIFTLIFGAIISLIITIIILFYFSSYLQRSKKLHDSNFRSFFFIVYFLTFPYALLSLFRLITQDHFYRPFVSVFGRFIHQNHIIIFLLAWFVILYYVLNENKDQPKYLILVGLGLILLQYSYMYYFSCALIFTALCFIIKYGAKSIRKLIWIYGTWFVLALPYIWNFFTKKEISDALISRAGALTTEFHSMMYYYIGILFAIAIFMIINYLKTKSIRESYMEISFFIALFIALNIQYITGYTIQSHHWIFAFGLPLLLIFSYSHLLNLLTFIKNTKLEDNRIILQKTAHLCLIILTVLLIIGTAGHLYKSAWQWKNFYHFEEEDVELIDFIKSTPKESVYFADTQYTNDIIAVNTERRALLGHPLHSIASLDELHQRVVFGYRMLNFSTKKLMEDINNPIYYNIQSQIKSQELTNEEAGHSVQFYYHHEFRHSFVTDEEANERLVESLTPYLDSKKEFKLDYVVYGKNKDEFENYPDVVFKNKKYVVRKL